MTRQGLARNDQKVSGPPKCGSFGIMARWAKRHDRISVMSPVDLHGPRTRSRAASAWMIDGMRQKELG